jgi:hypothetical protein
MMLGQRDLRAKASMQCLFGLVNEPYFNIFSSIGFNFEVLILGAWGLRPTYRSMANGHASTSVHYHREQRREAANGSDWSRMRHSAPLPGDGAIVCRIMDILNVFQATVSDCKL